jgi:hypothetical protein
MKLSPGDDITFSYEKSGTGYKITEVNDGGSRIGTVEGKRGSQDHGPNPPIVSNVLAAAIGSNGVITSALIAGVINGREEVMAWMRAVGNIAWEMSKGPSYMTVAQEMENKKPQAKKEKKETNPAGVVDESQDEIPF